MSATTPSSRLEGVNRLCPVGDAVVQALRGVDLTTGASERPAVTGPSVLGKTALMNMPGWLDVPTSGRSGLGGRDVARPSRPEPARARVRVRGRQTGFVPRCDSIRPADGPTGGLVGPTGDDTLRLSEARHREGQTCVAVSRGPQVAARRHRVVRGRDDRVGPGAADGPRNGTGGHS